MLLVDASFCVIWACRHQVGLVVVVVMMMLLMRLLLLALVVLLVAAAVMTDLRSECLLDNNWHHVVRHRPLVLSRGVEEESAASLLLGRVLAAAPMTECLSDWKKKKLHRNLSRPKMDDHCRIPWPSPSSS